MTENDPLDRAIDEAARELTAGEPSRAFRRRVLDRVQHAGHGRAWSWRLAGGFAAIALIAYFAWPQGGKSDVPAAVVTRGVTAPEQRPPSTAVAPPRSPGTARVGGPTTTTTHARRLPRRILIETDAPQLASLGVVEQLTIAVAAPRDLDVPDLSVREVAIAPLDPADKERR